MRLSNFYQYAVLVWQKQQPEWMVSYWRDLQMLTRWHDDDFDDVVMILGLEFQHFGVASTQTIVY